MPVPKPGKGEEQQKYISRCIKFVMDEGTAEDNKQAAAICYSTWRKHHGEGKSLVLSAILTKAEKQRDGRVRWRARANSGEVDQEKERFDESFFDDLVTNFGVVQEALTRSEVPSLPVPILDLAHYSLFLPRAARDKARGGYVNRTWRDGKAFMCEGYYDDTALGQLMAKAALERDVDDRRVSICVFPDWGNVEDTGAGRVYKGGRGVAYLDHLAMTAYPVDADTEIEILEVKSMTTMKDDAQQVLGDSEEAQKAIEELESARVKSETVPEGAVIKAEDQEQKTEPVMETEEKAVTIPQVDVTGAIAKAIGDLLPVIAKAIDEKLATLASLPEQVKALEAAVDALKAPTAEKVKAALDAAPGEDWLSLMVKNSVQRQETVKGEGIAEAPAGEYAAMFGNPKT